MSFGAHEHHEADLEVNVVRRAADPDGAHGAQYGVGNGEHHGDRKRPAFVKGREDEEHHEESEAKRRCGTRAYALFVVGLAGPLDRVALGEDRGAHLFGDADGVARRDALRGRAHELGGEIAVHARERVGARDALVGDEA